MVNVKLKNGENSNILDIVECDYYIGIRTLICCSRSGKEWLFEEVSSVEVSEDIVFNTILATRRNE